MSDNIFSLHDDHESLENAAFVGSIIKKYTDRDPIENQSITIKAKKKNMQYKLIRLTDDQFHQLRKNSLTIAEDYFHLMRLSRDKRIIYQNLSKMYSALTWCFGESGDYYDPWKCSFSFPFLLSFSKEGVDFDYLMEIIDIRASIDFKVAKIIYADDKTYRRELVHEPFTELPREEINYCINFITGYLTGLFKVLHKQYAKPFLKHVRSELVIYGYKDGDFFEHQYDSEEEVEQAVQELTAAPKGAIRHEPPENG